MTLEDQLRRTMASLTDRVREEAERQVATLTAEFGEAIKAERETAAAQASAAARTAAERELAERLNAAAAAAAAHEKEAVTVAVAAVETREREALAKAIAAAVAGAEAKGRDALAAAEARVDAAREAGRAEGFAAGKAEGEEWGRADGHREGLEEGIKEGRVDGRVEGREEGREEGRLEGRRAGQQMGFKEGKRVGREEGRKEALAEGVEKGRGARIDEGRKEGREEAFEDGRRQGRLEGQQEAADAARAAAYAECRTADLAANERLVEAIRAIDAARSLTEALDALASCAGREAARVAVLLVRGGTLRGWRWIGFGEALDERHDFPVPSADAGVIAEAARTGVAVSADSAAPRSAPAFAELPPGREVLAVPVQMSGQVIAVLYADQGADQTTGNLSWPATLEVLARHAARSLESMTAFRAAQVLTERPDIASRTGQGTPAVPGGAGGPVETARRYARLLVSEIKLYHESAVLAGRRERNLTTRLGGEIERARLLYEQRVPAEARPKDYFHEELVRTLADGDESLLEFRGKID